MNLLKLRPANWFKHEEDEPKNLPARNGHTQGYVSPFDAVHAEIDRMFDGFFRTMAPWSSQSALLSGGKAGELLRPSLDLKATNKDYQISVELPGVDEKDISLEIEDGALIISGEKKSESRTDDDKKGYYRMERSYGSFRRMLALPEDANPETVTATFKDGVLNIAIARKEVKERKKIAISS